MNEAGIDDWKPRGGLFAGFDASSWFVLLCWVGVLFLLPPNRSRERVEPPVPACLVRAWSVPFDDVPLALRPDLISRPSAVSFGAGAPFADSLQGVPPYAHFATKPLPLTLSVPQQAQDWLQAHLLRLAAANALVPHAITPVLRSELKPSFPASRVRWVMVGSPSLGATGLDKSFAASFKPPPDGNGFEAQLWVAFDDQGRPLDLFVEQSVNMVFARELVRALWNPACWTGATGQGRFKIRYLAGENDAD